MKDNILLNTNLYLCTINIVTIKGNTVDCLNCWDYHQCTSIIVIYLICNFLLGTYLYTYYLYIDRYLRDIRNLYHEFTTIKLTGNPVLYTLQVGRDRTGISSFYYSYYRCNLYANITYCFLSIVHTN